MKKSIIALATVSIFSGSAFAASVPKSSGADSRVQEILYNTNDVTEVRVKQGVVTLIQLEKGEFLQGDEMGMGLGDPLAWDVSVKSHNIFLRPKADEPDTNIALVTNKRTYSVVLKSSNQPSFIVRYIYPEPRKPIVKTNNMSATPCTNGKVLNLRYKVRGSESLTPSAIWDNGEFTCFKWSASSDLPVIYRVLPDGKEHLVNYHMEKDVMVVHEVSDDFILRLGHSVMDVKSNYRIKSVYNQSGTTNDQVLVERK